jgi:acyl-CoA hydrolase
MFLGLCLFYALDSSMNEDPDPGGEVTLCTVAMPKNIDPRGGLFGGWVMVPMDLAGGIANAARAIGRVVTGAVDRIHLIGPVDVGGILCVCTSVDHQRRAQSKLGPAGSGRVSGRW